MTNEISEHLKQRFNARMEQLGLSPSALAAEAGVTVQGLFRLRAGGVHKYQVRMTAPVCAALRWSPDSITRLLNGDEPIEIAPPAQVSRSVGDLQNRLSQVELALAVAIARASDLEAKRAEILEGVVTRLEAVAAQLGAQA
ncbi:MAG: hypothetical protein ACJAR2_002662 [Ilumatobacter sp.]|jgi:hypothetical protein